MWFKNSIFFPHENDLESVIGSLPAHWSEQVLLVNSQHSRGLGLPVLRGSLYNMC